MSWAVYQNTKDGCVHVAPCDDDGFVARGHILILCDCWCGPRLNETGVVVHNEPGWPGADEIMAAIHKE